jgi:mutator protein MutT
MTSIHLIVTAAVVERDGALLVTRRGDHQHLGGLWEFPGGKCEPGETLAACLRREMREELDVEVEVGDKIHTVTHHYAERSVELHFFSCELRGSPRPMLGQAMRWVARAELRPEEFPPADAELIALLRGA